MAPDLLGRTLVRLLPDGTRLSGTIVETEAYEPGDPASHGFRRKGLRNATMFGGPGRLYVYFTYGNHWMMNAVCLPVDIPSAVLLRAVRPLEGLEEMARRRGRNREVELASGPGKLSGAARPGGGGPEPRAAPGDVAVGIRVGVNVGLEKEWRFRLEGDPFVSKGRPGPPR